MSMSSVYFPAHVAVIFKRFVNAVSTFSISTQYLTRSDGHQSPSDSVLRYNLSWAWSNLFSMSPELNVAGSGGEPSSDLPPSPTNDERRRRKDPFELPPNMQRPPRAPDTIHQLIHNPALYDPIRTPRYPLVLCHGLYGFDSRGPAAFPSMRMHYWSNVLRVLRDKVGAEVIVTSVPGTGSIPSRASRLNQQLQDRARGRGVNFLAHSMGGLDCRHLISHIKPAEYAPLSLTSISTPHRGSPFMDWCAANLGLGRLREQERELSEAIEQPSPHPHPASESFADTSKAKNASSSSPFTLSLSSLPSSFTTLLLSIVDSPAYANLTSHYLNEVFNPATPDDPRVKYWSVAGRLSARSISIWHPFWLPKMVLDGVEEAERSKHKTRWENERNRYEDRLPLWANEREWGNDGLVTVQSAKWGEFLGIMEGCDHWEMRGARGIEFGVDLPAIPAIGLGGVPKSKPPATTDERDTNTNGGDGWGFGDWTRFVRAWRKSDSDARMAHKKETAGTAHRRHKEPSQHGANSFSKPTREEEEDSVVRSSTDSLSVVFDWLIDRVPIVGSGSSETGKEPHVERRASKADSLEDTPIKAVEVDVACYHVSAGSGPPSSPNLPPPKPAESGPDSRTSQQDQQRNELANREDLERFYIALTRRMYDEGL